MGKVWEKCGHAMGVPPPQEGPYPYSPPAPDGGSLEVSSCFVVRIRTATGRPRTSHQIGERWGGTYVNRRGRTDAAHLRDEVRCSRCSPETPVTICHRVENCVILAFHRGRIVVAGARRRPPRAVCANESAGRVERDWPETPSRGFVPAISFPPPARAVVGSPSRDLPGGIPGPPVRSVLDSRPFPQVAALSMAKNSSRCPRCGKTVSAYVGRDGRTRLCHHTSSGSRVSPGSAVVGCPGSNQFVGKQAGFAWGET